MRRLREISVRSAVAKTPTITVRSERTHNIGREGHGQRRQSLGHTRSHANNSQRNRNERTHQRVIVGGIACGSSVGRVTNPIIILISPSIIVPIIPTRPQRTESAVVPMIQRNVARHNDANMPQSVPYKIVLEENVPSRVLNNYPDRVEHEIVHAENISRREGDERGTSNVQCPKQVTSNIVLRRQGPRNLDAFIPVNESVS